MPNKPSSGTKSQSRFAKHNDANRQACDVSKKIKIPKGTYPFTITWYSQTPYGGEFEFKALDRDWKINWKFFRQNPNYPTKKRYEDLIKQLNFALNTQEENYYNHVGSVVCIKIENQGLRQFARYVPGAALQKRRAYRHVRSLLHCSVYGIVARAPAGAITDLEEYGAPAYSTIHIKHISGCVRQCIF